MASTGYVYDERYLLHKAGTWHPERPERLKAIHQRLVESGLLEQLVLIKPYEAPLNWIETLHDREYIDKFRKACEKGQLIFQSADNGICRDSYKIALLAVGGVLAACDAMISGEISNAFCAVRPPGHHAERARAMGFCFFNNIALGARYLQEHHGLNRIAIVDWDVHHGNGTQHLFEEDPSVLYISLHEDPSCCYPGTGRKTEKGRGAGVGYTLNIPMAAHSGDAEYLQALKDMIIPALTEFRPDCLMISAGFDAHADDPLAHMNLSREGYQQMGQALAGFAQNYCGSRIITVLEGGYNLQVLAECIEDHIHILQSL
ncbi:MAG: histone deacetylase [Deltaproteobacteria bacterium]|nr:histone deacetylase [Deltaproteobacteria bacterium]